MPRRVELLMLVAYAVVVPILLKLIKDALDYRGEDIIEDISGSKIGPVSRS